MMSCSSLLSTAICMMLTQNFCFSSAIPQAFQQKLSVSIRSAHCCLVFAAKLAQCSDYEQRTWKSSWKVTRWMGNVFVIELKHMKHKAWNIMALFMCYKHLIVRGIIKAWSCRDLCHIYHLWVEVLRSWTFMLYFGMRNEMLVFCIKIEGDGC